MRLRIAVLLIGAVLSVACGKAPTEPGLLSSSGDAQTPVPTRIATTPVRPAVTPTPSSGLDTPCHPLPKCGE